MGEAKVKIAKFNTYIKPSSDVVLLPCRTKLQFSSTVAREERNQILGLGQTWNPCRVEYIKNRCYKESTLSQRGSRRRTSVDPISQVALH